MRKIQVSCDESFPVYRLNEHFWPCDPILDIPESFFKEYAENLQKYEEFQRKLEELYIGKHLSAST
jgi:hypothetical protein